MPSGKVTEYHACVRGIAYLRVGRNRPSQEPDRALHVAGRSHHLLFLFFQLGAQDRLEYVGSLYALNTVTVEGPWGSVVTRNGGSGWGRVR